MIIESGNDVRQLICRHTFLGEPRSLWVIAFDSDLRLLSLSPVMLDQEPSDAEGGGSPVVDHIDDIAALLRDTWTPAAHYVLAWSTTAEPADPANWLQHLDELLRDEPELDDARLLGQVVFTPTSEFTTVPPCEFSLYPELSALPRALAIAGPHGAGCRCVLCASDRREAYGGRPDEYLFSVDDPRFDDYSGPDEYRPDEYGPDDFEPDDEPVRVPDYGWRRPRGGRRGPVFERDFTDPGYWQEPDAGWSADPTFDPVEKRWYPDPARAYKRWTVEEEETLVRMLNEYASIYDIALALERQPGAITSRRWLIGHVSGRLTTPVVKPPTPLADLEAMAEAGSTATESPSERPPGG